MHQRRQRRSKRHKQRVPPWLPLIPTVLLAVGVGLFYGATDGYYVPTESMVPTLQKDDQFRAEVWHSVRQGPRRGEIWVLSNPDPADGNGYFLVKRVIGLPGEKVLVKNAQVQVNGKALDEPYVETASDYRYGPLTLGPEEYFVLGDNRPESKDSHVWGPVKKDAFIGRAFVRYWPLNRFKWF
jgi:signal peptidase I